MRDGPGELHLVLVGATGFVGRLTAQHLARSAPPGARIALAGRSAERLSGLRTGLPESARDWAEVVLDLTDAEAVAALARRTRVVATTAGPYAKYGRLLLQSCAAAGTDYADLTGETLFVRWSVETGHERAERTGARLVHSCGFDSVPSDLVLGSRPRAPRRTATAWSAPCSTSAPPGSASAVALSTRSAVRSTRFRPIPRFPPTRAVLDRLLPTPGSGPDEKTLRRGRFRIEVVAQTAGGSAYNTRVGADLEPGYRGTAVMLGESALALAFDDLPEQGGVLTPMTAMGEVLAGRLRRQGFDIVTTRIA